MFTELKCGDSMEWPGDTSDTSWPGDMESERGEDGHTSSSIMMEAGSNADTSCN